MHYSKDIIFFVLVTKYMLHICIYFDNLRKKKEKKEEY